MSRIKDILDKAEAEAVAVAFEELEEDGVFMPVYDEEGRPMTLRECAERTRREGLLSRKDDDD